MDFDEVGNDGPAWAKEIGDLIAADQPDKALAAAREAFIRCVSSGDARGKVAALHSLAKVHLAKAELNDAVEVAEKALAELQKVPDDRMEGAVMHTIAKASRDLYRLQDADEFAQEALSIFQRSGSKVGEAAVLKTIAVINLRKDKKQDAVKVAKQSLAMFQKSGEKDGEADALLTMVRAFLAMRRYEDALSSANKIVGIYEGDKADLEKHCAALFLVADVRAAMEEHDEAVEVVSKAVELLDTASKVKQAEATKRLAQACFAKGDDTDGWMYAKEALELFRTANHSKGEAAMLCEIVSSHCRSGTFQEGVLIAEEALTLCREGGFKQLHANILLVVARARLDQEAMGAGQGQQLNWKARQAAKEAMGIYQDIGDLNGQMRAHNTLAMAFMAYGNVLEGRAKAKVAVELSQAMGDKASEGANLLLVAQSRFHDNRDEALRLANIAHRLIRDRGDKAALKDAEMVLEAVREEPKKKEKGRKGGGPSLADTIASKVDLTMDMDMMKTRAAYFFGFTSRPTR